MRCDWCFVSEGRVIERQADRPCPRCTFTGWFDECPTFVIQPYLSLTIEATVAGRQFAEHMMQHYERQQ